MQHRGTQKRGNNGEYFFFFSFPDDIYALEFHIIRSCNNFAPKTGKNNSKSFFIFRRETDDSVVFRDRSL